MKTFVTVSTVSAAAVSNADVGIQLLFPCFVTYYDSGSTVSDSSVYVIENDIYYGDDVFDTILLC